jgi:hypothetical protein
LASEFLKISNFSWLFPFLARQFQAKTIICTHNLGYIKWHTTCIGNKEEKGDTKMTKDLVRSSVGCEDYDNHNDALKQFLGGSLAISIKTKESSK